MKMTYLMTKLVWKVFISSKPFRYPSCPPLCGHFSIQENAVGALSYKVKKQTPYSASVTTIGVITILSADMLVLRFTMSST